MQKSNPSAGPFDALIEPRHARLHTLRRPATDGRLQRLIPWLLAQCKASAELHSYQSLAEAASGIFSKWPKAAPEDVRTTAPKAALATKTSSTSTLLHYTNSIDLQPFTLSGKILFGQKTWVDLLENDETNLKHNFRRSGLHLSTWVWIVRLLQKLLPWNNFLSVAEECFYNEIKFGNQKPVLMPHELVSVEQLVCAEATGLPIVLVTGTLGRHYGTLDAFAWSRAHQTDLPHQLWIAGPCPDPGFRTTLETEAKAHPGVNLDIWPGYAPQAQVLGLMAQANYMLCPYVLSPATQHRIPTKFAEAQALRLPLIIPRNAAWARWCLGRSVAFSFMDTPNKAERAGRQRLDHTWVEQRKALQTAQAIQGLGALLA